MDSRRRPGRPAKGAPPVEREFDAAPSDRLVGRAAVLDRARAQLSSGGSVLLSGPAGIGKSAVLRTLTEEFGGGAVAVLRCSPTESESHLPFLSLIDLLEFAAGEVSDSLPAPQRAALEAALTGRADSSDQPEGLALRLAVLSVLRTLAGRAPVLVVADDLQWMDPVSTELLAFAARRLGGLPVRFLAAVRTGTDREGCEEVQLGCLASLPRQPLVLRVPPLSTHQLSELLADRKEHPALHSSVLQDIHRTSGGNPFYALELARALAERPVPPRPGEPLPVPTGLRTLVLNRLGALSPEARTTLLIAGAGARPTLALLRECGRPAAEAEIAEAAELGIARLDPDGVVRFTHPLISAALYSEAPSGARREAHTALAGATSDPIERARHLALATSGEDEHVARTLEGAASVARERGAPAAAARLGLLAADRTPPENLPEVLRRRLCAAEDALVAGDTALARGTAREVLAQAVLPADRVRAWIVVIDSAGQAMADVDDAFPQALADAGEDPRLLAPLLYQVSWRAALVEGSLTRAREVAARSASLAARVGDRRTELLALAFQALTETLSGHPDAEQTLERALQEPQDPRVACDHNGPGYLRFSCLLMGDRLDEARAALAPLVPIARRRGAVESEILFLRGLADTELRAGRCETALELAHESLRLAEDVGVGVGPALHLAALAEAAGGSVQRALSLAHSGIRRSEEDGDRVFLTRSLTALGHARLMGSDAHGAVVALRRVRELEEDQGVAEPARGRWQGDLAEALVRVGALAEAQEVIDVTRDAAVRLGRGSVLGVLERAQALLTAERGDLDGAAAGLRAAGERLGRLGYRLEEGRTRLALYGVEAQRRGPGAARAVLEESARIFRRAKALPWLELVAAARERAGHRSPHLPRGSAAISLVTPPAADGAASSEPSASSSSSLSSQDSAVAVLAGGRLDSLAEMERRVAALVLEGSTNREIAAQLFVSVKTVEATLTRVYRKLGIRSRVDIVRLAALRTG
ncbi:AAA family ATPase [Streptomyces sp. HB2AG]|uniref:helix-turn-helix transcriptional regulator n=1 Tax=Streptomyces sp. HB2AG TaxID=2983400 RepID=UPI003FA6B04E